MFLKGTLSPRNFHEILRDPSAIVANTYIRYLREMEQLDELDVALNLLNRREECEMVELGRCLAKADPAARLGAMRRLLQQSPTCALIAPVLAQSADLLQMQIAVQA